MKCVFIVLDTVRRDYLAGYGNDWVHTPSLTRLAERGITFDNHWAGSLPCMPARREFMTGRYNFVYRGWGPIEPYDDTLPGELRKKEIFTHLLTDHYHYYELGGENYHTAFNTWDFHRGQENDWWASHVDRMALPDHLGQLSQQNFANRKRQQKEEDFSGPKTAQAAIEWLENNKEADNWFLQVEIFDPHEPFYCTDKYREMYNDSYDGPIFDWPSYDEVHESPEAIEHIRKCYAGLLTMTDHWVGKICDRLNSLGLWDDTLIVFTTDHGTMLAEHDYWMKNIMPLYNEIVRIPLIMSLPGNAQAGTRNDALTQNIDLMPTFLDHFDCPLPPHVQGQSILRTLEGHSEREDVIFGYFGMAMNITDGRYVYMRNPVNEDAGPLYAYTAMPTGGLKTWYPREVYDKVEMGRYYGHTYNLPLYKIPTTGKVPKHHPDEASYAGRNQMFDILEDPAQNHPMHDTARESRFIERITHHLKSCEAQTEQYTRLGISYPG
ncbi:MAG: sulfatase [Candidatus Latescibacteria bacterium]|nr:sulfatase [Candidatus Latescibacterota bacterium]